MQHGQIAHDANPRQGHLGCIGLGMLITHLSRAAGGTRESERLTSMASSSSAETASLSRLGRRSCGGGLRSPLLIGERAPPVVEPPLTYSSLSRTRRPLPGRLLGGRLPACGGTGAWGIAIVDLCHSSGITPKEICLGGSAVCKPAGARLGTKYLRLHAMNGSTCLMPSETAGLAQLRESMDEMDIRHCRRPARTRMTKASSSCTTIRGVGTRMGIQASNTTQVRQEIGQRLPSNGLGFRL